MTGTAVFSDDQRYRWFLTRSWSFGKGALMVIGLNCSTATATEDDPTIRRCIGFAQDWGYQRLLMTNLFAFRATDPKAMKAEADPVGEKNDDWIVESAAIADLVVCAWGAHGRHLHRDQAVLRLLEGRPLHHLGLTRGGHPRHPLYLSGALQPQEWVDRNGTNPR